MNDRSYKILMRIAIVLTIAWVGWTIYDSDMIVSAPGAHDISAAVRHLEDGQYEDALAAFDRAQQVDPENIGILRGKAQARMQMGARDLQLAIRMQQEGKPVEAGEMRVQAESHQQAALDSYDQAILLEESRGIDEENRAILGVSYANRGILKDRMGDYAGALADYEMAMDLEPEINEGPGLLTRFMRNQPEKPPTIADRVRYLKDQLSRPESERLLSLPDEDAKQRAYKMD